MNPSVVKGVSIIICTYNGAQRLPQTLQYLAAQKVKSEIPWEIVLVDNASTDNSSELSKQYWDKFGTNVRMQIFSHPIPGKTGAMELGFTKANYDYLLICDDDNWLETDYVQLVYEIMSSTPEIGVLGGNSMPACDSKLPQWFEKAGNAYATGIQYEKNGPLENNWEVLWGAGMALNRKALQKLSATGFKYLLTTKRGKLMISGEDDETCYAMKLIDYKVWYDSRLRLTHFITQNRVTENYLKRLMYSSAIAVLACEPYQQVLAFKQNPNDNLKNFSRLQFVISLIKFFMKENLSFFIKFFHANTWVKINYRSQILVHWLRIKHTSLMNRNLRSIKKWFTENVQNFNN